MSTVSPTNTIENEAGIKHPFFAEVAPGESLTVAAVLKEIDQKETPYGPVNRYKGDFIIRHHKNGKPGIPAVEAKAAIPAQPAVGKKPAVEAVPAVEGRAAVPAVPASVRTVRSGTVYFPANIGAEITTNAAKIEGGWDSCEFKFSVSKDKDGKWNQPSWSVLPRVEGDRVLSLLNS